MKEPKEKIEGIAKVLRDKMQQGIACYYSIKINKDNATTELAHRKLGDDNFLKDVAGVVEGHKPDTLIVQLYTGKSRRVQHPEAEYYIEMGGRDVTIPIIEPAQSDNSYMLGEMGRHFERQIQNVRELSGIQSDLSVARLEMKHKDERIQQLVGELKQAEEYIEQLEGEVKSRPQLSGPGGLNILDIGSYMLEGMLRRNPAIMAGALGITEEEARKKFESPAQAPALPSANNTQATATVTAEEETPLTPEQQKHAEVVEAVAGFLRSLPAVHLRKVYDLMTVVSKDVTSLDKMMRAVDLQPATTQDQEN